MYKYSCIIVQENSLKLRALQGNIVQMIQIYIHMNLLLNICDLGAL